MKINKINPNKLLNSKWTRTVVVNKEKHFLVTETLLDQDNHVVGCVLQAVINNNQYTIAWQELQQPENWHFGWQ